MKTASWVIREKSTGNVVMETFDRKKVAALNTKKYEAVPIMEHLKSLNEPKRKKNPAQGGERLEMLKEAAKLYREFSGEEGELVAKVKKMEWPKVAAVFGECDGILYSTVRDGKDERYIHRFKKSARPLICTSHDGKMLVLVMGKYTFTSRGIVDSD